MYCENKPIIRRILYILYTRIIYYTVYIVKLTLRKKNKGLRIIVSVYYYIIWREQ